MFFIKERAANPAMLLMWSACAVLAISILKDVALLALGKDLELRSLASLLTLSSRVDSWQPIYDAVEFERGAEHGGLYETVFFGLHHKFQYPPTSLLPFTALHWLGVDRESGYALMRVVNIAAVVTLIVVMARIWLRVRTPGRGERLFPSVQRQWTALAGAAIVTITFYPVIYAVDLGQIQVLIDLAVAASLLFWIGGRKFAAGALIAFSALIKPQFALLLVWAVLRREWRFLWGFMAVAAPVGLVSLFVYGLDEHLGYVRVLSFISLHGETPWMNQSMNGLLHRLVGADLAPEPAHGFGPYNPVVYFGTLISSAAFILFAFMFAPRGAGKPAPESEGRRKDRLLDLCVMIMVLTIASPVAWEHHYGVALPIYVIAFALMSNQAAAGISRLMQFGMLALALSYFLVSNYLLSLDALKGQPPLNIMQSYIFIGGLILIGVLTVLRMTPAGVRAPIAQVEPKPA